jgi:hypothetical protein
MVSCLVKQIGVTKSLEKDGLALDLKLSGMRKSGKNLVVLGKLIF